MKHHRTLSEPLSIFTPKKENNFSSGFRVGSLPNELQTIKISYKSFIEGVFNEYGDKKIEIQRNKFLEANEKFEMLLNDFIKQYTISSELEKECEPEKLSHR